MKAVGVLGLSVAVSVAVVHCAPADEPADGPTDDQLITDVARPDTAPEVLVKDPRTLVPLEGRFGLGRMLGATGTSGADLHASSAAYRALAAAVTTDVRAVQSSDSQAGKGFAYSHRLFDDAWLQGKDVRFELTGVTNRLDLAYRGGCGEVHLVYRMAYTTGTINSRLPLTVNLLVPVPDDGQGCRTVAQRWLGLAGKTDVAQALTTGPLANLGRPTRVEIDFQVVRWPSTTRDDMGGHAEYVLRAFALEGDALRAVPLDDTPRPDLGAAERTELRDWIAANVAAIDQGTAQVPEKFLATKVVSVAPRAASRLGNKPFKALLKDADFASVDLSRSATVSTPAALLHKLDGMSCQGCHQSRGIAGFQLLGEERKGTLRLNALQVGASPHLIDAAAWRLANLKAVAEGKPALRRNAPDHASGRPGLYGAHCSLGRDPGFADWTCGAGLTCKKVDDDTLGQCLPAGAPGYGDACEQSTVTQTVDPRQDRVSSTELACGGGATCFLRSGRGFPDGMCQKKCDQLGAKLSADGKTICAGVPFGSGPLGGFNKCLFELRRPFEECLADDQRPTTSRACDENNPCRDDYACVRVFTKTGDNDGSVGACVPPYFVFQGRVDGHTVR